jgi:predicted ester cyclase
MRTVSGMSPTDEGNVAVVRCLVEDVLGAGRMLLLPELIAPGYVGHLAIGDHYGPDGVRIEFTAYRTAIAGLVVTLDDLFASNGRVARRFTLRGTSRTSACAEAGGGRPVALHGIAIDRLEDGRLVESWVQIDDLAFTL